MAERRQRINGETGAAHPFQPLRRRRTTALRVVKKKPPLLLRRSWRRMMAMSRKTNLPINPLQGDELLQKWQRKHDTPAKVAAAHRKVLLERVSQSMAFENQPVSTERLKTLLMGRR
jgi:hypothetical protein